MKAIYKAVNEEKGFAAYVFKENDGYYQFRNVYRKDGEVVKITLFVQKNLAVARADEFAQTGEV